MGYYRMEGSERLKSGLVNGEIEKNGEKWHGFDEDCPIGSCICFFEAERSEMDNIFNEYFEIVSDTHDCILGERVYLLKLEGLDKTKIKNDDSVEAGWIGARKYFDDITHSNNVEVLGYGEKDCNKVIYTEYNKPKKVNMLKL